MRMIVRVAALPAIREARVIAGVRHGLVNMGRGRGWLPLYDAVGRERGMRV